MNVAQEARQALRALPALRFRAWTFPLALLGICFLAFGLQIGELGFYQDDWQEVWYGRSFGVSFFRHFFANERPFNAFVHMLTNTIAGDRPLNWHLLILGARWLSALALWWALRVLWPERPRQPAWISLLYAVYPLFREQAVAVTYAPFFLLLASHFVSEAAMLKAMRDPRRRWAWVLLSLLTAAPPLLSLEHFFPLELLRPVFLWIVASEGRPPFGRRLRRTLLAWLPFLAGALAFLYWRLVIFQFPTYQPQLTAALRANFGPALVELVQTILEDSFEVTVFAWVQTLEFARSIAPQFLSRLKYWALILSAAALTAIYLYRLEFRRKGENGEESRTGWSLQAIAIGLYGLLIMGWPAWYTQLKIGLEISAERFTLVYMPVMSILVVGLIELLIRTRLQKVVLLGVLVGLAVGLHFDTARGFVQVTREHEIFFRQLAWRIPSLEPNTLFLSNPFPSDYSGSSQFTSALNWVYDEQPELSHLDYMWFYIPERLGGDLPTLEPGTPVVKGYRAIDYTGSTDEALAIFYEPPGCLLVIDPQIHGRLNRLPDYLRQAARISHPERIQAGGSFARQTVESFFGPGSSRSWCEYFEKADLARQQGEWDEVVRLGKQAQKEGLRPASKQDWEYFPFIEGYAHLGDWQAALELSRKAARGMPAANPAQCALWERIASQTTPGSERDAAVAEAQGFLECAGD